MSKELQISHTFFADNSIKIWFIKPTIEMLRWFCMNKQVNHAYVMPDLPTISGYMKEVEALDEDHLIIFENDTKDVWQCKCGDPDCNHGIISADGVY